MNERQCPCKIRMYTLKVNLRLFQHKCNPIDIKLEPGSLTEQGYRKNLQEDLNMNR